MTARELPTLRLEVEIVLRLARQDDLPKLEWYGQYTHFRPLFRRSFKEQQEGRRWMLVADCNGFPIGQLFVQLVSDEVEIADGVSRGYFYALRVMEMFRGQGIGTRLIEEAEFRLVSKGFRWATIAVAKENEDARRLYERMGYQIFRADPGEWRYRDHQGKTRNVREPCWIMEKGLRSE
jgi:ribosomal protein S18 acetylase RimI-like enzyme